jgi:multidrug efflux pump subunit AcrA (membrane-fusion protein)
MPRRTLWMNTALAAALVGAGTAAYATVGNPTTTGSTARAVTVTRQTVSSTVSATGNVVSQRDLGVNFTGSGVVTAVDVKIGQRVVKGQVLAHLDDRSAQIALQQADAQLASAEGQYETTTKGQTPQERQRDAAAVAGAQVAVDNASRAVTNAKQQAALDKTQLDADVSTTRSLVQQDEAKVNADKQQGSAGQSALQQDEAKLEQDQATLRSQQQQRSQTELKDEQSITNAEGQLKSAKAQLAAQQATAAVDAQPAQPGTIQSGRASIAQAQAQVKSAQLALDNTILRAPAAGTVASIAAQPGEQATSSGGSSSGASTGTSSTSSSPSSSGSTTTGFIVLTDLQGLQVAADFAEADAVKVHPGQAVTTTFNALTSNGSAVTVSGTVESVAINSTVSSNVVEYAVGVSLTNPPTSLKVGQTANVTVLIATRENVLAVPSAAVTNAGATPTVTVLRNGTQQRIPVTVGLVGDNASEITSGASAGDQVVLPTTTSTTTSNGVPGFRRPGTGGLGGGLGG